MSFWTLLEVATMPVVQVILITILGALMACDFWNVLHADARKYMNKVVFMVFTPSLMFASLAKTVTLEEIISWWFMPINTGLTFLFGGILGWILVKVLKPMPHLEGLIIASCASGNLGNLVLIVLPSICNEERSPFGERGQCRITGLSYASFSMALGGFFIWTYTFHLVRTSSVKFKALEAAEAVSRAASNDLGDNPAAHLLKGVESEHVQITVLNPKSNKDSGAVPKSNKDSGAIIAHEADANQSMLTKVFSFLHSIVEELMAPPTLAAIAGFLFGAVGFLKNLIIGDHAPLRVIQDSIKLLGDGTIPCITLILGGNLTQGLRTSRIKPLVIIGVVCVRYVLSPIIGIWVVRTAKNLGFLSDDPLYEYALMIQYTVPPAMNIGTMTELFDVAKEECSVLMLWTYLVAAIALTVWSTIYMWILV